MRISRVAAAWGLAVVTGVTLVPAPASAEITVSFNVGLEVTSDEAGDTMVFSCVGNQLKLNGLDPWDGPLLCTNQLLLVVHGNGGDDVIDVSALRTTSLSDIGIFGGDGNDRLVAGGYTNTNTHRVLVFGDAGEDILVGQGSDVVDGGPGTDTFSEDLSTLGADPLDVVALAGGLLVQTGGSAEVTSWSSVEVIDTTLNEGPNTFYTSTFAGAVRVRGNGGNDTLVGGGAADILTAGTGDDTVDGGAGGDTVDGGEGNDVLRMRDGEVDGTTCGEGSDVAFADPGDTLAGCESVDLPPVPVPPDTSKPAVGFKKARFKAGAITVPVSCPAELRCLGTARLAAQGKVKGKKRTVRLDTLIVVLDNGKGERLKVRLTKAEKKAVLRIQRAKLRIRYDVMDAGGNVATGTTKVALKFPA